MVVLRETHSGQGGVKSLAILADLLLRCRLISLLILFTSRPIIDFRRMSKFNQFSVNARSKGALSFQETSLAVLLRLERGQLLFPGLCRVSCHGTRCCLRMRNKPAATRAQY